MENAARGCPNLQYLNLEACYDITDVSLLELGRGCPNLQILKCKDSKRITTTGALELGRGCPNLQNFGVPNAEWGTDKAWKDILDSEVDTKAHLMLLLLILITMHI